MENTKLIYLLNANNDVLCALNGIDYSSVKHKDNLMEFATLSFTINKYIDINGTAIKTQFYEHIKEMMYVYLTDVGIFRIENVETENDGYDESLNVECNSCEIELNNQNLVGWKVNTGDVDSLEYIADDNVDEVTGLFKEHITFYNPENPQLSLLDLATENVPYWSIGYVDALLRNKRYTFDIDSEPICSFLINELSTIAKAIFIFDRKKRKINVYSFDRFNELGKTNIVVGYRNLLNTLNISKSNDNIYTRFNVSGADDLSLNSVNFNENRIENLLHLLSDVDDNGNPVFTNKSIYDKYKTWYDYRYDEETGKRKEWVELARQYNQCLEDIEDITYRVEMDALDYTQYDKFDEETLLKAKTNYVNIVNAMLVDYKSQDDNGNDILDDDGICIIDDTKMSDFKNSIYYEDYKLYINIIIPNIKIALKNLYVTGDDKKIEYIKTYETEWDLFGTVELQAKIVAYDNSLTVLKDAGYAKDWNELLDEQKSQWLESSYKNYHAEYVKVFNQKNACLIALNGSDENNTVMYKDTDGYYLMRSNGSLYYFDEDWNVVEISEERNGTLLKGRKVELEELNQKKNDLSSQRTALLEDVDIKNEKFGFTDEELNTIYRLRKDSDYVNENILTTSLDGVNEKFEVMEELYQDAMKELDIESQPQYSFTITMDNFYEIEAFKIWKDDFKVGNLIHISLTDTEYIALRVVSIERNPCVSNDNSLTITFSNILRSKSGLSDYTTLFQSAIKSSINQITSTYSKNFDYEAVLMNENLLKALANSSAFSAKIGSVVSDKITSKDGEFDVLTSKYIGTDEFEARLAKVSNLEADSAFVKYLNSTLIVANEIDVDDLKAKMAQIDVATIGSVFAQSLQTFTSTTVTSTVDTQFVCELLAGNVKASEIFGKYFVVGDDDSGKIVINGSTMQFTDIDGNVYIQLGTDEKGGHSLIVKDINGTTLLNGSGITKDAITDGLIVDKMIKKKDTSYSGISPDALNIDELGYEKDKSGKWVIKSSYVYFDKEKQSLEERLETITKQVVAFDVFIVSSNGTEIETDTTLTAVLKSKETKEYIDGNFTYEWYKDGKKIEGATNKSLYVTANDFKNGASYDCIVGYDDILLYRTYDNLKQWKYEDFANKTYEDIRVVSKIL